MEGGCKACSGKYFVNSQAFPDPLLRPCQHCYVCRCAFRSPRSAAVHPASPAFLLTICRLWPKSGFTEDALGLSLLAGTC